MRLENRIDDLVEMSALRLQVRVLNYNPGIMYLRAEGWDYSGGSLITSGWRFVLTLPTIIMLTAIMNGYNSVWNSGDAA